MNFWHYIGHIIFNYGSSFSIKKKSFRCLSRDAVLVWGPSNSMNSVVQTLSLDCWCLFGTIQCCHVSLWCLFCNICTVVLPPFGRTSKNIFVLAFIRSVIVFSATHSIGISVTWTTYRHIVIFFYLTYWCTLKMI